ncbi:MAG: type II toxin-antitoxin system YafQ family toxin [Nevskia sp.]|nr:type II toxin-antitoxin system YafQ family toxin [Nevskia sp.]
MAKNHPRPQGPVSVVPRASFAKDLRKRGLTAEDRVELAAFRELLLTGEPLPAAYNEHALREDWAGYLECHLAGDWLVIYKRHPGSVVLYRTGTHGELFTRKLKR